MWIFTYGQELDKKYTKAVEYIRSIKGVARVNVSPVIRKMGIDAFEAQLKVKYNLDSLSTIYRSDDAYKPYFSKSIKDSFSPDSSQTEYISFSKPRGNLLVFEIRNGYVKSLNLNIYFGRSTAYFLIFNSKDEIIDSYTACIQYN